MTPEPASQVAEALSRVRPEKETLLTIGVFDGVHLGHQALLKELRSRAQERGMLSGVITFQSHPRRILQPSAKLAFLNGIEDRLRKIRDLGIDLVVAIPFTGETARIPAREFVSLLQKYLRMKGLVVGPDFALGRQREGN
ncbi:MAG: bifunctional riboflavin kinase/FMN adenylyltransferase, partial [Dehalococcoidia bacterium]|nr:bifunctional riboflavin kinase/FMN adenylyltransferase [Dehalococcoidia bacterium]